MWYLVTCNEHCLSFTPTGTQVHGDAQMEHCNARLTVPPAAFAEQQAAAACLSALLVPPVYFALCATVSGVPLHHDM
jgi:hypothetical protein